MIKTGLNIDAFKAIGRVGKATSEVSQSLARLSSGLRINSASDDPAGLQLAMGLNQSARNYTQAIRNINDGVSVLSIADQVLNSLAAITTRQRELAEQASNGTFTSTQRQALNAESTALTAEYNRILNSTKFNGSLVFGEGGHNIAIQAGITADSSSRIALNLGTELESDAISTAASMIVSSGTVETTNFNFSMMPDIDRLATITFVDADSGSYDGAYIIVQDNEEQTSYIWFDTGGSIDPGIGGPSMSVEVNPGQSAAVIAAAAASALSSIGVNNASFTPVGNTISVFLQTGSNVLTDLLTSTPGTITITTQQADRHNTATDGNYITFSTTSGDYYLYFGSDPGLPGTGGSVFNDNDLTPNDIVAELEFSFNLLGIVDAVFQNLGTSFNIVNLINGAVAPSTMTTMLGASFSQTLVGSAKAISAGTDTFTSANHSLTTGQVVRLTTSGTLPGNLNLATDYYAIKTGANTFKLASSQANALAGTAINISSDGVGFQTLSYTATTTPTIYAEDISLSTQQGALAALTTLSTRAVHIQNEMGLLGAHQSRMQSALAVSQAMQDSSRQAADQIMSADIAQEAATLLSAQIRQQGALAVVAQANQQSKLVLQLLATI